jgi:HlyD family secretion protein
VNSAPLLETQRATAISAASAPNGVVLNATGYIVAAHKIELAAKVVGKVKWIGVDKGDHVQEGQVLVRLEDDEYQANVQPARGATDQPCKPSSTRRCTARLPRRSRRR